MPLVYRHEGSESILQIFPAKSYNGKQMNKDQLSDMNCTELRRLASEAGIAGRSKMKKGQLVTALNDHYLFEALNNEDASCNEEPVKAKSHTTLTHQRLNNKARKLARLARKAANL